VIALVEDRDRIGQAGILGSLRVGVLGYP